MCLQKDSVLSSIQLMVPIHTSNRATRNPRLSETSAAISSGGSYRKVSLFNKRLVKDCNRAAQPGAPADAQEAARR